MNTRSLLLLFLCGLAWATQPLRSQQLASTSLQTEGAPPSRSFSSPAIVSESTTAQPQAHGLPAMEQSRFALRLIPTTVPPVVDGSLGDACWQNAPVISDFTQVEPSEGAAPTERTEVRVLYDRSYLYVAVRCFDSKPEKIRGTQMQHDADLDPDDSVALIFDTFGRTRSGYLFKTNPAGAKLEGLVEANGSLNTNWDTIWFSRSRRDERGWTAEIAIPFRSLSFDPNGTVWGFNVERTIRRKQEIVRWAFPFRNKSITSLADVGELRDLAGITAGIGLEMRPFFAARYRSSRDGTARDDFELKPGLDAFLQITPAVTAALTLNTDFAETEVDARQVNLTRFPISLPEKRGFFLADANLFSFGSSNAPRPFYSRRIGLSPEGEALDILAGGKISGRVGNLELGLLDVQVDESAHEPATNFAVARLSYRLLGESSVGAIFSRGSPRGSDDNWLVGTDLNYRNSHVAGNNLVTAQGWFLRSDERGADGRQMAFGGSVAYPNEPFWIEASAAQIDQDFDPGVGFVSRTGVRNYRGYARYRLRPGGYIRTVDIEFSPSVVTNLDDLVESDSWTAPAITLTNQRGDSLNVGFYSERENLFDPFEIQPGVIIRSGDYRFNRGYVSISTTSARPFSAYGSFNAGEFYDGTSEQYSGGIDWRPSPQFYLALQSELDSIVLPGGKFDVVVSSARFNVTFSPDLSWNTLIQHDNVSNSLGFYSRLKWTVRPGSDLYLVFKNGFDIEDGRFRAQTTEISTKVGYAFRY